MTDFWVHHLGTALGGEAVDAAELVAEHGPVREGFLDRTGFARLYRGTAEESGLGLAKRVLASQESSWWSEDLDALLYVTSTGDLVAPGNSHLLQADLGLGSGLMLLDINDACTGFVRSLRVAHSLISSGAAKRVLLVLSDTYSKLYDPAKLTVSPLFSDGASAFVVSRDRIADAPASSAPRQWRVLATRFLSEGARAGELSISHDDARAFGALEMNGAGVLNFVLKNLEGCLTGLTSDAEIERSDIDRWYVHQGSRTVVSTVEKSVGRPVGSLFRSAEYGNTVGSSLPFMLAEDNEESGERLIIGLLAFGVGLTMAGMVIEQLPAE